ncbi:hypothetical protein [Rheinheimera salexigens]|uniref:DUF4377 domain-containing protein n=1 Tax=Rheinheimera salexigens TaxID=1628148 RepID=A0A1E7Q907_9GAMM|nr:hypothetical protein [Rheinheimera salexigens]OEY70581.1 hypothetical protein BI198_14160 [Rheinheimera salexigens]
MIKSAFRTIVCLFILILSLTGCDSSSDSDDLDIQYYQVLVEAKPEYFNPEIMHTLPLNALATGQGGPDTRANLITGFSHSFGTKYNLDIRRYPTTEGGQSGYIYELVKIISSNQDEIGTVYQYPQVELSGGPIGKDESGKFYFYPYEFKCAENVDCETLVNIADSGGVVSLELTLTGDETVPVTLTYWQ